RCGMDQLERYLRERVLDRKSGSKKRRIVNAARTHGCGSRASARRPGGGSPDRLPLESAARASRSKMDDCKTPRRHPRETSAKPRRNLGTAAPLPPYTRMGRYAWADSVWRSTAR